MRVPWKAVLRDIKDAVSDYDCDVEYDGATEDYQGNVLCDFIVTFNDPDSIADWKEVIDDLYDYDDDPELQELLQQLTVTATVEGDEDCFKEDYGKHPWLLEWDANMARFTSLARADQGEDKDASAS